MPGKDENDNSTTKRKIQNLFLGHQKNDCPEELGYRDLTPEADTKIVKSTLKHFIGLLKIRKLKI